MTTDWTWRDVTSYSRSDKVRDPRTYELRGVADGVPLVITVTRHIDYDPDVWLVSLAVRGNEVLRRPLQGRGDWSPEEGGAEALEVCRAWAGRLYNALLTVGVDLPRQGGRARVADARGRRLARGVPVTAARTWPRPVPTKAEEDLAATILALGPRALRRALRTVVDWQNCSVCGPTFVCRCPHVPYREES